MIGTRKSNFKFGEAAKTKETIEKLQKKGVKTIILTSLLHGWGLLDGCHKPSSSEMSLAQFNIFLKEHNISPVDKESTGIEKIVNQIAAKIRENYLELDKYSPMRKERNNCSKFYI